ncbi:MAG: DUF4357 domain-containing protein [Clostridia bacterium]|nr:DUF4357 domain-containing protein [Clostridia bacterium]
MAKGIIYCMTTIVPGLVKIGKTGSENFEQRMYNLERNGYVNVVGLNRRFAIEVEDYDEKEILIHELFSKSNVPNTELFAVDVELVVQLLSSLEGKQVFPKSISKEEVFNTATDEVQRDVDKANRMLIPDGTYYIFDKNAKASMRVENGNFIVEKGSKCLPCNKDWMPESRKKAKIENGILTEDVICKSPSTAGWVVLGNANNGWFTWKTEDGKLIDIFRKR